VSCCTSDRQRRPASRRVPTAGRTSAARLAERGLAYGIMQLTGQVLALFNRATSAPVQPAVCSRWPRLPGAEAAPAAPAFPYSGRPDHGTCRAHVHLFLDGDRHRHPGANGPRHLPNLPVACWRLLEAACSVCRQRSRALPRDHRLAQSCLFQRLRCAVCHPAGWTAVEHGTEGSLFKPKGRAPS